MNIFDFKKIIGKMTSLPRFWEKIQPLVFIGARLELEK